MDNNIDDSNYREFESLNRSMDTEASFLKKKLIETHNKLLKELELNKELDNKLALLTGKCEHLKLENESLQRKLGQATLHEKSRDREDRQVLIQKRNNEMESKNELLRIDLESMRNKVLSEMLEKSQLEEAVRAKDQKIEDLQHEVQEYLTEIKKKEVELVNADRNAITLRQKNQSAVQMIRKITLQLEERRKTETMLNLKILQFEAQNKSDKQKINNLTQECKNYQRQVQLVKSKLQNSESTIADLKNKLYIESKQRPVVNNSALQKMTQQFNSLNVRYKQLQKQLEQARNYPISDNNRKRRDFVEARDFVQRLQNQQKKLSQRRTFMNTDSPPKSINNYVSPINTYAVSPLKPEKKQNFEKREYMDIISEIGVLENTLLQCNISKNKILNEMDKIDGTKTKTHELINRRRRLEDELKRSEALAEETKKKLKTLNVI